MKKIIAVACAVVLAVPAAAGPRSVGPVPVVLGDWDFVPTLDGQRVESIVALTDPAWAVGDNITAVWFRRTGEASWEATAWAGQNNLAAIAHVKATLGLPDSSDAFWPDPAAAAGVDVALAEVPALFARGVFAADAFAPVIEAAPEPGPVIGALSAVGWAAASLPVQTVPTACSEDQVLTTLAAMFEADTGAGAGGAIAGAFTVPAGSCAVWRSLSAPLGGSGAWAVPDLTGYLEATAGVDPAGAWQSVAAGTVYAGERIVRIDAGGLDAGGAACTAVRLVIALEDVTAPDLSVALTADGVPAMVAPGGLDYALSGSAVWADILTSDNTGGAVTVGVSIDCVAAAGPVTVAGRGFHTLLVTATDAAGNTAERSSLFAVRDGFNLDAAAAVAGLSVTPGAGQDAVDAVVLLSAEAFDPRDINVATLQVWLSDAAGVRIGGPLAPAAGWPAGGAYDPALVSMTGGVWSIAVSGAVPAGALDAPGASFAVTGSGLRGLPGAFDLSVPARAFVVSADPLAAVLAEVTPPAGGAPPPPPPVTDCVWKFRFDAERKGWEDRFTNDACGDTAINMEATAHGVWGAAGAEDWCYLDGAHADSDSVVGGGTVRVFLEPSDCCEDCTISIIARPRFTASATVAGGGTRRAASAGLIDIGTPCGNTSAFGGVAVGDYGGPTTPATVGGRQVDIPVHSGDTADETFMGNISCARDACSVDVSIATGTYASASADTNFTSWSVSAADGKIFRSALGMVITPQASGACVVPDDGDPIHFEDCNDGTQTP